VVEQACAKPAARDKGVLPAAASCDLIFSGVFRLRLAIEVSKPPAWPWPRCISASLDPFRGRIDAGGARGRRWCVAPWNRHRSVGVDDQVESLRHPSGVGFK